jgi:hypothetical protein
MTLLTEVNNQKLRVLTEDTAQGKKLFIEGTFAVCDTVNKNSRIYPRAILEAEMARYKKESIDFGDAVGELNHPISNTTGINAERIAISIKSVKRAGNHFIGKALVCDSPCGRILEGLINSGVKLGLSTRGTGSLRPLGEGVSEVQDDFRLISVDIVCSPSADAYFTTLMEQHIPSHQIRPGSVEHTIKNKVLMEQIRYIRSQSKGAIYRAMIGRMK